jgi:hypothetical protein
VTVDQNPLDSGGNQGVFEPHTLLATLTGLDDQDDQEPDRPDASQLDLLDVLPHLTVNLHRVPEELLDRLFDLTQLTIQVHYASNEATMKVTLPADDTPPPRRRDRPHHGGTDAHTCASLRQNRRSKTVCILYVPPVRLERTLDGF